MSTYINPGQPHHSLTSVTLQIRLDLVDEYVQLTGAYGHSDSTKGILWASGPDEAIALDDEPYAFHIVGTAAADLLERVAHFLPNTQERYEFTASGGLHGMDPMF